MLFLLSEESPKFVSQKNDLWSRLLKTNLSKKLSLTSAFLGIPTVFAVHPVPVTCVAIYPLKYRPCLVNSSVRPMKARTV